MIAGNEHFIHHSAEEPDARLGSGVYVDVENLEGSQQQTKETQEFIKSLLADWPETTPKPARLTLYVKADQSNLWNIWAGSRFPEIANVSAAGVQHFSKNQSKNSADIAMAIDAITDIALGRISCVVVVSDDSDFIPLFSKFRDEKDLRGSAPGAIPFLWVLTDRQGTKSDTIKEFFPDAYIRTVSFPKAEAKAPAERAGTQERASDPDDSYDDMAQAIIKETDIGIFKSTETQNTVKKHWPSHPLAKASKQTYGEEFRKRLLPPLQKRGVTEPNPNKKPREYSMTAEARSSVS